MSTAQYALTLCIVSIPLLPGHTSAKLAAPLLLMQAMMLVCFRRLSINKSDAAYIILYVLLIAAAVGETIYDRVLSGQFMTAMATVLALSLQHKEYRIAPAVLPMLIGTLAVSSYLYFRVMAFGFLLGNSRLDVLAWQEQTALFFGINRYLLALMILVSISVVLRTHKLLKIGLVTVYFISATYLGSRAHSLISAFFVLYYLWEAAPTKAHLKLLVRLTVACLLAFSIYLLAQDESFYGLIELYWRYEALVTSNSGPRATILQITTDCIRDGYLTFFGNALSECTTRNGLADYDNTFLAALGYGGILGGAILVALIALNVGALAKLGLEKPVKALLIISYVLVLNVDVLLSKPAFFYPLLLLVFDRSARSDRGVPGLHPVSAGS